MKKTYELVGRKHPGERKLVSGRIVLEDNWQTGIKCLLCYNVTYDPQEVKTKFCSNCGFFHSNDWRKDPVITIKRKIDPVFAGKLLRGQILYLLHSGIVGSAKRVIMGYRTVKRFFLPVKKS